MFFVHFNSDQKCLESRSLAIPPRNPNISGLSQPLLLDCQSPQEKYNPVTSFLTVYDRIHLSLSHHKLSRLQNTKLPQKECHQMRSKGC